ncbi:hypothetical protein [Sodalis sp. dw_96]|uniref:hypothetical protein n=1 Tax=Sodalis sp. dw_96 TaxID=2719794 RepID=UPI001BD1FF34|nr:hypothetical protein [Sodalis sp. dw_96]
MCISSSYNYSDVQIIPQQPTHIHQQPIQIDWDGTSPRSPSGLAASLKRAANIAMSWCAMATTVGLVMGALALMEYLSTYSLREINNVSSELESELWQAKRKYQRLALCVGGHIGLVSGMLIGAKLPPCLGIPHPFQLVPVGIIGLYIGVITGFVFL